MGCRMVESCQTLHVGIDKEEEMKYRCPKCKKTFYRDGRTKQVKGKRYIISYCDSVGGTYKCYKPLPKRRGDR